MGKALHLFTEVLRRSAAGVKAQVVSNTESGALGHRPLGPFNGIERGGGSGESVENRSGMDPRQHRLDDELQRKARSVMGFSSRTKARAVRTPEYL
jgi:hypothetical protein